MIAVTFTIPDWIFCGPFWAGFVVGLLMVVVFFLYILQNGPWR